MVPPVAAPLVKVRLWRPISELYSFSLSVEDETGPREGRGLGAVSPVDESSPSSPPPAVPLRLPVPIPLPLLLPQLSSLPFFVESSLPEHLHPIMPQGQGGQNSSCIEVEGEEQISVFSNDTLFLQGSEVLEGGVACTVHSQKGVIGVKAALIFSLINMHYQRHTTLRSCVRIRALEYVHTLEPMQPRCISSSTNINDTKSVHQRINTSTIHLDNKRSRKSSVFSHLSMSPCHQR